MLLIYRPLLQVTIKLSDVMFNVLEQTGHLVCLNHIAIHENLLIYNLSCITKNALNSMDLGLRL